MSVGAADSELDDDAWIERRNAARLKVAGGLERQPERSGQPWGRRGDERTLPPVIIGRPAAENMPRPVGELMLEPHGDARRRAAD